MDGRRVAARAVLAVAQGPASPNRPRAMTLDPKSTGRVCSIKERMAALALPEHHDVPAAAPVPAFPDDGVSLGFLRQVLRDPRLSLPMVGLPVVGPDRRTLVLPPTAAELEELDLPALQALGLRYRAFSDMAGSEEGWRLDPAAAPPKACADGHPLAAFETKHAGYGCDGCGAGIAARATAYGCRVCDFDLCRACHDASTTAFDLRAELLAALRRPPTTTTQVCECIIKPDTLDAGCSYARMLVDRGEGDGTVGKPTVFLSHAWRFNFKDVVETLLGRFDGDPAADSVRVWNDVFVVDENNPPTSKDYFFSVFKCPWLGL